MHMARRRYWKETVPNDPSTGTAPYRDPFAWRPDGRILHRRCILLFGYEGARCPTVGWLTRSR